MWKNLLVLTTCTVCVLGIAITENKIIGKSLDDLPLFGASFVNKYSKIAREIVHNSSEILKIQRNKVFFCKNCFIFLRFHIFGNNSSNKTIERIPNVRYDPSC